MSEIDYSVYLVTDAEDRYAQGLLAGVEAALPGGVTMVQYRPTGGSRRHQYEAARRLTDLLRAHRVPLIINDSADLALAVDADGVHVGQHDLPGLVVRRMIGPKKLLGLSITAAPQLTKVDPTVNYLGVGPVFTTATKADAAPAMGLAQLTAIVAQTRLPVVAIGGIDASNAAAVFATGVAGVAVVSAFSRAKDPAEVAREIGTRKGENRKSEKSEGGSA